MVNKYILTLIVLVILPSCSTIAEKRGEKFLTDRALSRAAKACGVESLGIHYTRGSNKPYGDYLVPSSEINLSSQDRGSGYCMDEHLKGFSYQYLGELEHRPKKINR